jgi:hypothetical protein
VSTPIILLVGQAGSGKDTAAELICKNFNAVSIAQADPMKRFAAAVFRFSDEQLWGPSSARNALDTRFALASFREEAFSLLYNLGVGRSWINDVLPDVSDNSSSEAFSALLTWAEDLLEVAGEDGGLTARKTLQTLGTEWGRHYGDKDMWVNYATKTALKLLSGGYGYSRRAGLSSDPLAPGYDFAVITDGRFRNELVRVKVIGGKVFQIKAPDTTGAEAEAAGVKGHTSETEQRGFPPHWYDAVVTNDKRFGFEALEETVSDAISATFNSVANEFVPTELLIERVAGTSLTQ